MKEKMEKKMAKKIVELSCSTVQNTVGKSIPLCAHEVKMPKSIRTQYLNKENAR